MSGPWWTSKGKCLELIDLSSENKVSVKYFKIDLKEVHPYYIQNDLAARRGKALNETNLLIFRYDILVELNK
jgi:hypothetical protein